MKSETRTLSSETQFIHSALTPSELAALLGPCAESVKATVPIVAVKPMTQWTSFTDEFSRRLAVRLRPLIRVAIRVKFVESRKGAAETLGAALDSSSAVRIWQSNRSIEPLAVTVSNPLLATFVDRLLGSHSVPNDDDGDYHRPLTDVDTRLASRLIDAIQETVSDSAAACNSPIVSEPATAPRTFAEAWLPESELLHLAFELQFVQGGGSLGLLIPVDIAETISDKSAELELEQPNSTAESFPFAQAAVPPTKSTTPYSKIAAQLALTSLKRTDLKSLAVGDVLLTGNSSEDFLRVTIDGQPQFLATAGAIDGRKAVRISTGGPR